MEIVVLERFEKDFDKINKTTKSLFLKKYLQVENANSINEITSIKKMKGYSNYYRIRIGNYRIGIIVDENTVTFVRFLHRSEIYKSFT